MGDIRVTSRTDDLGEKRVGELGTAGEPVRVQAGDRERIRTFAGGARTAPGDLSNRGSLLKALPGSGRARHRVGYRFVLPALGPKAPAHEMTGGWSG